MMTEREKYIAGVNTAAVELLGRIIDQNLDPAAQYIEQHPPSPAVIASMPWIAHRILRHAEATKNRGKERPGSIRAQIRKAGVHNYDDARLKAPELLLRFQGYAPEKRRQALTDAIYQAWKDAPRRS
jgi:hypothetical protein